MTGLSDASRRQNQASQPNASTWLSANAGSGKTRVLTDRVARLLLSGAEPANILCLTYTKAAASEMQNRLFQTLGAWAMKPEAELRATLSALGETSVTDIGRARTLFARAIETPGGLRIQTIHSFCSSILRRFPLEAGVTPTFSEMDDTQSADLRRDVIEQLIEKDPDSVTGLIGFASLDRMYAIAKAVAASPAGFGTSSEDEIAAACGLSADTDEETILTMALAPGDRALIGALADVLETGVKANQDMAASLRPLAQNGINSDDLPVLEGVCLYKTGAKAFQSKAGTFPRKSMRNDLGGQVDALDRLMDRIEVARQQRLALSAYRRSLALHRFAAAFIPAYAEEKSQRGVLDYDDLIQKTLSLLTNGEDASWVLYKLDGDIDHMLIDEAQDTSPDQWRIIGALAEDIAAGQSDRDRTIFVVGDKKQSIYSFQGADPREFDRMRSHFSDRLRSGPGLLTLGLEYSFRSSSAVLGVVDETFAAIPEFAPDLDARHIAFSQTKPGRVDVWPRIDGSDKPEDVPWWEPIDVVSQAHHSRRLADAVAREIKRLIDQESLPTSEGRRRISAGDIMILLQARSGYSDLFYAIIAACKNAHIEVAGADRLKLGGELAVRDLIALMSFVALPEDDLALATALRSPFFGWSEAQLYDLAANRGRQFLWTELRNQRSAHSETLAILDDLRSVSDYFRPYELIDRILVRHGGRQKLLARLGDEAEDGLDELLNQALSFERSEIPSLTKFLSWIVAEDVTVKRQLDSAGDKVRVMTVHGAKGLEAPIVILPDATRPERRRAPDLLRSQDAPPLWPVAAKDAPQPIADALDDYDLQQRREKLRLMYVAMTRAENWLIVCGSETAQNTWHDHILAGTVAAGGVSHTFEVGEGIRFEHGDWDQSSISATEAPAATRPLPDWVAAKAPTTARPPKFLSPSELGGSKALASELYGPDREEAMAYGSMLHRLLEVLPDVETTERRAVSEALCIQSGWTDHSVIDDAFKLLADPKLRDLFAPDVLREVDISAPLSGTSQRILGTIDLLQVRDAHVLAVDFKSNTNVPARVENTPDGILRQMGAYADALAQVFPDRQIETAVLWTRTAELCHLPHEIVRNALQDAAIS